MLRYGSQLSVLVFLRSYSCGTNRWLSFKNVVQLMVFSKPQFIICKLILSQYVLLWGPGYKFTNQLAARSQLNADDKGSFEVFFWGNSELLTQPAGSWLWSLRDPGSSYSCGASVSYSQPVQGRHADHRPVGA